MATLRGRSADAASGPEPPPATIEQAIDRLKTLVSSEALAAVLSASEDELVEFERGIRHIMDVRWFNPPGTHPPALSKPLGEAFDARKVDRYDRAAYLLSSLWRRHKGLPLDRDQQLATFHEHRRRLSEAVESYRRALPPGTHVTDLGTESLIEIVDVIHFKTATSEIEPGEELLLDALAATLKGYPEALLFEAQGHAAASEPHARALSLSRARVVKEGLAQRGVEASRLTAHGLGTRFTIPGPEKCPDARPWSSTSRDIGRACVDRIHMEELRRAPTGPVGLGVQLDAEPDPGPVLVLSAPTRDRRVDFVILRRKPRWPTAVSPASRDASAAGDAR
jgi:outer membrane protein OmpA-like peptidoglycan-associated protein